MRKPSTELPRPASAMAYGYRPQGRQFVVLASAASAVFLVVFFFLSGPVAVRPSWHKGQTSTSTEKYWSGWPGVEHLFVFGDSYSSIGFVTSGEQPSPGNPLGNPPYPGSTTANGPNWVGLLATEYNRSTILTYDLAFGGATVDNDIVEAYHSGVPSLKKQVLEWYMPAYVVQRKFWTAQNSLFAFFIGINDVGNSYAHGNLNGKVMDAYAALVDHVYDTGARNFVFLNVPPVDRAPMNALNALAAGKSAEAVAKKEAGLILDWNKKLVDMVSNFSKTYPGATVFSFDTHTFYGKILDDPKSFEATKGIRNTTEFCAAYREHRDELKLETYIPECGVGVHKYFWVDQLHPTVPVHNATAAEVAKLLSE